MGALGFGLRALRKVTEPKVHDLCVDLQWLAWESVAAVPRLYSTQWLTTPVATVAMMQVVINQPAAQRELTTSCGCESLYKGVRKLAHGRVTEA